MLLGENIHVARKRHLCESCMRSINAGERYIRQRGVWEGEAYTWKSHELCMFISREVFSAPHNEGYLDHWPNICDFDRDDWQWLSENQTGLHLMFVDYVESTGGKFNVKL
jgi:hypothetical protein